MGTQPTLKEKSERVGVDITMPSADIVSYLHKAVQKGQAIHYLPPYRAEHKLKLMDWLGVPPARQEGSVPFIRAVIAQRNYKSAEEIVEIEKACDITADMHITAMKILRPGCASGKYRQPWKPWRMPQGVTFRLLPSLR